MSGNLLSGCCCNAAPPPTSCCRPIYSGCVGKTYEFKFRISLGIFCPNEGIVTSPTAFSPEKYKCNNNPNIEHDITNNLETFEITLYHTIEEPIDIQGLQSYLFPADPIGSGMGFVNPPPTDLSNRWWYNRQFGSNAAMIPWQDPCFTYTPSFGCGDNCVTTANNAPISHPAYNSPSCEQFNENKCCALNGPKTTCEFGESELRSNCGGCFTSLIDPNSDAWSACYHNYILKSETPQYEPYQDFENCPGGYCPPGGITRCRRIAGNANLLNNPNRSPSINFIPNPSYPEQLSSNYIPKIQLNLIEFNYFCAGDHLYDQDLSQNQLRRANARYHSRIILGIGYKNTFDCGTDVNGENITETLDLPFFIAQQWEPEWGQTGSQPYSYPNGLYLSLDYVRFSLESDPMNICIPESSKNVPLTIIPATVGIPIKILTVDDSQIYADEYSLLSANFKGLGTYLGTYDYNEIEQYKSTFTMSWASTPPNWNIMNDACAYLLTDPSILPTGINENNLFCRICPNIYGVSDILDYVQQLPLENYIKISSTLQVQEID